MSVTCKCTLIFCTRAYEQTTYSLRTHRPASDIWWAPVHYFSVSSAVCPNRKCHGGSTDSASTPVRHRLFYTDSRFMLSSHQQM